MNIYLAPSICKALKGRNYSLILKETERWREWGEWQRLCLQFVVFINNCFVLLFVYINYIKQKSALDVSFLFEISYGHMPNLFTDALKGAY